MAKTIVIIGAGPGVGMAIAERFGAEGYNVALLARNKEKLNELTAQLTAKGISTTFFQADVLDRNTLIRALEQAKAHFGTVDVLEFSPASPMGTMRTPRNIDIENMLFHLDFQVLSAIAAVQTVLPDMLQRKEGSILFTTAPSAQKPLCVTGSFGVAAGALLNYARLLNKDLSSENIFAGIVSIAGIVYNGEQSNTEVFKHFPEGMPYVAAKDVAEAHWEMHTHRKEYEVIVGDMEKLYAIPGFY